HRRRQRHDDRLIVGGKKEVTSRAVGNLGDGAHRLPLCGVLWISALVDLCEPLIRPRPDAALDLLEGRDTSGATDVAGLNVADERTRQGSRCLVLIENPAGRALRLLTLGEASH